MHNLVEILDIFIFTNKKTNKSKYKPICQQSEADYSAYSSFGFPPLNKTLLPLAVPNSSYVNLSLSKPNFF